MRSKKFPRPPPAHQHQWTTVEVVNQGSFQESNQTCTCGKKRSVQSKPGEARPSVIY